MTGDEQAVKVEHEYLFDKNTLQKKEQDMDNSMKITAGLGSIDEYERFVQAGADEFSVAMYHFPGRKNMAQ